VFTQVIATLPQTKLMTAARPPNTPWCELNPSTNPPGYLSYYYSDDLSEVPVRWVTKPGDNKSDPNLETLTYGLFSTCARGMRAGVVKNRAPYIFFFTNLNGERVLCGYYRIRWFAIGSFGAGDYCLAADKAHFLTQPIPLIQIDRQLHTQFSRRFRSTKCVSSDDCARLITLIEQFPDASDNYRREIQRLERFNLHHGGFRYIGWRRSESFGWGDAQEYLTKTTSVSGGITKTNASPTDHWTCSNCGQVTKNKALLKRCPFCGKLDTLLPVAKS
jgi:hypothetical protein